MGRLLVVAGEGSGDAFAAAVVQRLGSAAFGLGGARLAAAGVDLIADLVGAAAMGISAPLGGAPRIALAVAALVRAVRRERPRAALLVGFSEVNARLAAWLRGRGVRVLWYAPPQVWAWRPGRAAKLATVCDQLAVILPFEAPLWRRAGARVEYVGHPALECGAAGASVPPPSASPVHRRAGDPVRLALLPGSRSHEIRAHLGRFVGAALKVRERLGTADAAGAANAVEVTIVRAAALGGPARRELERAARAAGFAVTDAPVHEALAGQHVAIAGSGTATLECAVLAVPPVIVYRTDPLTFAVARRLVRVPHVGLPNLVLGRAAFPELIQGDATPDRVADAARQVLEGRPAYVAACHAVRHALDANLDARTPSARVADLLSPWLA